MSAGKNHAKTDRVSGFILTRQWREVAGGLELTFWANSSLGPLRFRLRDQEAVYFIPVADQARAENLLARHSGIRFGQTSLKNFKHSPVTAVYCRTQKKLYLSRDVLQSAGITVYEADVNPPDRFLMERFITGSFDISGTLRNQSGFIDIETPRLHTGAYDPKLSCVSIDIETAYGANDLYSIGIYNGDQSIVLMVGEDAAGFSDNFSIRYFSDEKAVLSAFIDWVVQNDPDVLIGWNVVNFDLRFIQDCCDRLGLVLALGRNHETVKWRTSRENANRFFALVPGRVVLDGIELMRGATYQFENFSLEYVSRSILGRGKLVDDVDQRGDEITDLFLHDKLALAAYNLEDCKLVWDIFEKENLTGFAIERSILTGLELNRYGGSVAAFDYLYLPRLHRSGFVAPALTDRDITNPSPGGYVLNSKPGIYDHVIVLDFKSLYPSIIRTFHVDPLALAVGVDEEDSIEGFDGGKFSRHLFILPQLIENLWQARDRAKLVKNKVLSQAIKIIMNSFYGVLGTTGCRFFDTRLVSSITRRGHQIIVESRDFIQEQNFRVIYGDTDSLFVLVERLDSRSVEEIGHELAKCLNDWWSQRLLEEYQLESCLEVEFETHYDKFLMPTVRGADTGSKKRYAGLIRYGNGETDYQLVFKGLETVRSDWSPLARKFQKSLYEKVFLQEPFEEYISHIVKGIFNGDYHSELVLRRRLRRKLNDYVKNVPPHVQAARKAEHIRQQKGLPAMYEQGGWVEYVMTTAGPEPRQYCNSPIDYDFYVERQITPIADSILVFRSTSMKELLNRQLGLF